MHGKKMFSIPSTHIFSEYFSSYSSGGLISYYFSFDSKDGGGEPTGFFIYLLQKGI